VLSSTEVAGLIKDIYTDGGLFSKADFTEVASALDAMNNQPHLDSGAFHA
jgi:hypothetical protein